MDSFESLLNAANLMKMNLEEAILKLLYQNYGKPFLLESRIKSVDKIKLKQKLQIKKGYVGSINCLVPDIIGFRISVDCEQDIEDVKKIFSQNWNDFGERICMVFDYIKNPKSSGFKAITLQYRVVSDFSREIPYEIQIMTKQMRDWTNKTHLEYDKKKYKGL